jgi:co-chaperonin GroES (HSP10)
MNIELFDGDLLVRRDKPEVETKQGIVLPDAALKPKLTGTVVLAAGTMKDGSPARYRAGDRVRFRQHMVENFANVEVDGETLILMPSHWCWARETQG